LIICDRYSTVAEYAYRPLDSGNHRLGISIVGLDRQRLHAKPLGCLHCFVGLAGLADIGYCDVGAFARATFENGGAYAAAAAGD
jgi:hypothetical protein